MRKSQKLSRDSYTTMFNNQRASNQLSILNFIETTPYT